MRRQVCRIDRLESRISGLFAACDSLRRAAPHLADAICHLSIYIFLSLAPALSDAIVRLLQSGSSAADALECAARELEASAAAGASSAAGHNHSGVAGALASGSSSAATGHSHNDLAPSGLRLHVDYEDLLYETRKTIHRSTLPWVELLRGSNSVPSQCH